MARLPIVGGDLDNWGDILNAFLLVALNADGTLKDDIITAAKISDADVANIRTLLDVPDAGSITTEIGAAVDDLSGVTDAATARSNLSVYSQAQTYTQAEVTALIGNYLLLAGGVMTGKITLDGDPTAALHAATKQYVDANIVTGGNAHDHVGGDGAVIGAGGISSVISAWASKSLNTIYQAATDGILIAYGYVRDDAGTATATIKSDASATPTTVVCTEDGPSSPTGRMSVSMATAIRKGHYYQVSAVYDTVSINIKFWPLGS